MATQLQTDQWVLPFQARPSAHLRVFCLPYAGGGASIYRPWLRAFPETVEVCAIQLPGREQYLTRKPFTRMDALVERLTDEVIPWLDRPYLLFGHSMGAFISFELTRSLRRQHRPLPARLCVSGARAPHLPYPNPPIRHLGEEAFVQRLRELEGTPTEVLAHHELIQLLLPLMRADFTICETYTYVPEEPLVCPLSVFGGRQDQHVAYADLLAWQQYTRASFALHMFEGNHFFLHACAPTIVQTILQDAQDW